MKKYIVLLVTILSISSCLNKKYDYPVAKLPQTPENLELFNTEYNDYNSTCPTISSLFPLCFSSDRNSEGEDFDIIYHPMNITWNKESGRLTVIPDYAGWSQYYELYEVLNEGMDVINSSANEFGPYFIADLVTYDSEYDFLLIFSNDVTGKQQIKYSFNNDMSEFSAPEAVEFLSSDFNDMYPSYNVDFSAIYFCSDRADETFDIYKVAVNNEPQQLVSDLSDQEAREIELVEAVSSEYNDKCPFVYGNMLVFASDRPGGEGGFDLYYSLLQNSQWSAPVNFGPSINSAYNDYRPIVINEMIEDEQAMMIFSSDRPGGQGGYDLYFVGIDYTDTE